MFSLSDDDTGQICVIWLAIEQHVRELSPDEPEDSDTLDRIRKLDLTKSELNRFHDFRQARNELIHKGNPPSDAKQMIALGKDCQSTLQKKLNGTSFVPSKELSAYGRVASAWHRVEEQLRLHADPESAESSPGERLDAADMLKLLKSRLTPETHATLHRLRMARNNILHRDEWSLDEGSFVAQASNVAEWVRAEITNGSRTQLANQKRRREPAVPPVESPQHNPVLARSATSQLPSSVRSAPTSPYRSIATFALAGAVLPFALIPLLAAVTAILPVAASALGLVTLVLFAFLGLRAGVPGLCAGAALGYMLGYGLIPAAVQSISGWSAGVQVGLWRQITTLSLSGALLGGIGASLWQAPRLLASLKKSGLRGRDLPIRLRWIIIAAVAGYGLKACLWG